MPHPHRRAVVLAIVVSIFFAASAFSQTVTTFTVPGATHTRAFGISPSGEIVGLYAFGTANHGFLLSGDRIMPIVHRQRKRVRN